MKMNLNKLTLQSVLIWLSTTALGVVAAIQSNWLALGILFLYVLTLFLVHLLEKNEGLRKELHQMEILTLNRTQEMALQKSREAHKKTKAELDEVRENYIMTTLLNIMLAFKVAATEKILRDGAEGFIESAETEEMKNAIRFLADAAIDFNLESGAFRKEAITNNQIEFAKKIVDGEDLDYEDFRKVINEYMLNNKSKVYAEALEEVDSDEERQRLNLMQDIENTFAELSSEEDVEHEEVQNKLKELMDKAGIKGKVFAVKVDNDELNRLMEEEGLTKDEALQKLASTMRNDIIEEEVPKIVEEKKNPLEGLNIPKLPESAKIVKLENGKVVDDTGVSHQTSSSDDESTDENI